MLDNGNVGYYLVLEKRPGDYNLIDINKLDICAQYVPNDIVSIDAFTSNFSENELREAVKRSNMVQDDYIVGSLRIISDLKHNLAILTKDDYLNVINYQEVSEEIDQNLKNKIFGMYKKIVESVFTDPDFIRGLLDRFKEVLRNNSKEAMFQMILELPYHKSRSIYLTIASEVQKRNLEKLRKLEKLSDVA